MIQKGSKVNWIVIIIIGSMSLVVLGLISWVAMRLIVEGDKGQGVMSLLASATPVYTPTPSIRISQKDGMEIIFIPAGKFVMGSKDWDDEEILEHIVELDGYWVDRTEVTNGMFTHCVEANGCTPPRKKNSHSRSSYYGDSNFVGYPIINVDWYQSMAYCEWAGGRLPSEAEWEKAGRGTDENVYPWGIGIDCEVANFKGKEYGADVCVGDTTPVDSYSRGTSSYGVLDMAGNVAEWVQDWYADQYYTKSPQVNPMGPSNGDYRVVKGGGWNSSTREVEVIYRTYRDPNAISDTTGFRCVRSP